MKIVILGDAHFGARGDSIHFHESFRKFYENAFFPYLIEHDINKVIQLGDIFERRKYVNFLTLQECRDYFFNEIDRLGIELHIPIGNHDTYYKSTNSLNSPALLLNEYSTIKSYSDPTSVNFDGLDVAMIPWICADNYDDTIKFLDDTKANVVMGHLELSGFAMYKGSVVNHGMDSSIFNKFDLVCSGHFHHKSTKGNIHYLGTPYEITWSDYDDPRGFHVLDTETLELTFIENPYKMFYRLDYDDTDKTLEEVLNIDFEKYRGTYLKLNVIKKNDPYWYELFINKLDEFGIIDIQIIEEEILLEALSDEDLENPEDTLSVLKKSVETIELKNVTNIQLENFLTDLYYEAKELE